MQAGVAAGMAQGELQVLKRRRPIVKAISYLRTNLCQDRLWTNTGMLQNRAALAGVLQQPPNRGAKNALIGHFYPKSHLFTKTGSGET
jgi:hypothetical protein